jgi:hypothetical protein
MHESAPQGPPSAETIARGHESSVIGLRGFVVFLGYLVLLGAIVCLAMWGMMLGLQKFTARKDPTISPLAETQPIKVPEPLLQPSKAQGAGKTANEAQDLKKLRDAEDAILGSYAIDPKTGAARIPIDRAMEIMLQQQGNARGATTQAVQPTGGGR